MKPHLIALDLDGTTLNPEGALSEQTVSTLQQLQKMGHKVVIATGRPDSISSQFYDQLQLTTPLINFNGALIHKPHQQWQNERQQTLTIETALALRQLRTAFPIKVMVAEGKQLLIPDRGYQSIPFLPDMPQPVHLLDEAGLTTPPISVTMFVEEQALDALGQAVHEQFPSLEATTWGAWSGEFSALEVTATRATKSQAIAYVSQYYQIPQARILAFGDDRNDLDMLQFAGTGIAMGNAKPDVLAIADAVTTTNAEDGVAQYLQQYFKIK